MEFKVLISYFFTVPFVVVLDLLWTSYLLGGAGTLLRFGFFLPTTIDWGAVAAFYIVFTLGLFYFGVYHGFSRQSLSISVVGGVAFGFFVYATYDLALMAIIPDTSVLVALFDVAWGMALSGAAAAVGFSVNRLIIG